ncbi:MAG TPA: glutamate cyclase domain-containing protein, partial [Caproiciproducens sp.]|nr:glutamate cyclase domain-containing protein [Caproiciproducens sp.]
MTQEELTQLNVGQNLDDLMNLDPRGYGVCRILYDASRKHAQEPLTMHAAKELVRVVKEGDLVYIFTGFVLIPSHCAETDGIIGAMLLARALVKAFNAKPVIICPEDNLPAVRSMSCVIG